jgi:undecaprenyl-diphosphatase
MFLFGTAVLLVIAELVGKHNRTFEQVNWVDALWIGTFQVLALFPGVSRSGSTITGGMTRNLERPAAARFSFLMSVPVMLAAGLIAVLDLLGVSGLGAFLPALVTGFLVSAVVGYVAIAWLLRYLTNHRLYVFAVYVVIVAILTLITL